MILEAKNLNKQFILERGLFNSQKIIVKALANVSFSLNQFDSLGLVGESGSGKTTLAKVLLKLILPTSGDLIFSREIENFRRDVQIIFQNPYNSLNPKMKILDIISEPLIIHRLVDKRQLKDRTVELLKTVQLETDILDRLPREFSGGQRQRICIARALATNPKFLVLDEPISSLDLTIQAKLLDLFLSIKERYKLTYIFISHNLAVIKYLCNKVLVMKDGQIIEKGPLEQIYNNPAQEYTKKLLEAAS